jgi:hypothetical protein
MAAADAVFYIAKNDAAAKATGVKRLITWRPHGHPQSTRTAGTRSVAQPLNGLRKEVASRSADHSQHRRIRPQYRTHHPSLHVAG